VISGLLREPESEEVRCECGVLRLEVEQWAPVIGARRESVQEEKERPAPAAAEYVDAALAELLIPPALAPGRHAAGQLHGYRLFFFFLAL
jgi:hypothetical protein